MLLLTPSIETAYWYPMGCNHDLEKRLRYRSWSLSQYEETKINPFLRKKRYTLVNIQLNDEKEFVAHA